MSADAKIDWPGLLEEALNVPGSTQGIYDRFYPYSYANQILLRMQGVREPVAPYKRWQKLGRQVVRGAKAKAILQPVVVKIKNEDDEPEQRVVGFKLASCVFPASATTGEELPPFDPPTWDLATALGKLGIREVPFDEINGNLQGWSRGLELGVNPVAANPAKTRFHEMGHIVLGHTIGTRHTEYVTHRGVMEFEAESTAYLTMHELGQLDEDTAIRSRGYIQHWMQGEKPPETSIRNVFKATDAILRAGRIAIEAAEE